MNILAFLFFFMAALWMLFAILYALSVVVYLRMRALGRLHEYDPSDPRYGRVYLCAHEPSEDSDNRCYIPMGWIFRRFLQQNTRNEHLRDRISRAKVMTMEERRDAMAYILIKATRTDENKTVNISKSDDVVEVDLEGSNNDEVSTASAATTVCAICLSGYGSENCTSTEKQFSSTTCSHSFHFECILDWLARPSTIDCPCCRVPMVNEETVGRVARERRKRKKSLRLKLNVSPAATKENDNEDGDALHTITIGSSNDAGESMNNSEREGDMESV
eukprot:CAMPEP_0172467152 /NCGR_PEP_ID=MMETSP1065-20121228/58068_1 /TAXON_ID=265537 /ORGANISM="Amphiprora paludosa, Strain CCMP125" /LENGTH=274 /DNA_ID=CAMNT_0013224207 /DNA_START=104 /DNA_END=928 /DNA_ORIENTATION=-